MGTKTKKIKKRKEKSIIPGFGLSLGYTTFYLGILLILPLAAIIYSAFGNGWKEFWEVVTSERVVVSYILSFKTALISATVNAVFGTIIAWVLVRYTFPFKKVLDSMVDLPFALPTAVAGISLTSLFAANGWIGQYLTKININVVNNPTGIVIALVFIGFPFVVRNVQPVLQEFEKEVEEAASSLGANRFQIFKKIIFPNIFPAILTGFTLSFARAIGEYGSVIFISGNLPYKTEITPLLIMSKLDQFKYGDAAAISVSLLGISFIMLFVLNGIQYLNNRKNAR
jgi:sulfate/thiosulfate transport system permease protein